MSCEINLVKYEITGELWSVFFLLNKNGQRNTLCIESIHTFHETVYTHICILGGKMHFLPGITIKN